MTRPAPPMTTAAIALLAASPVFAHARLVSADPPAKGVTARAPARLHLRFSEAVAPKLSGVSLAGADGRTLPIAIAVDQGGIGLTATVRQALRPGIYTVSWHAVSSDDGHRTAGSYRFTVR